MLDTVGQLFLLVFFLHRKGCTIDIFVPPLCLEQVSKYTWDFVFNKQNRRENIPFVI